MTNTYDTVVITDESLDQVQPASVTTIQHRTLRERGMITIEYAMGIVLVIAIVMAMVVSIQQGWFGDLFHNLVTALFATIQSAIAGG
jgi:Flp pilus assembly pilin Flp